MPDFFEDIHIDKLFLATAGISLRTELTYHRLSVIAVKKAMLDAAETTFLVADPAKLGKNEFTSLGALSLIDYIKRDPEIAREHLQLFKTHEIEVHK